MNTRLLDLKLKDLFGMNREHKMEAISMLIDSIRDDAVYEAEAAWETEIEYNKSNNKDVPLEPKMSSIRTIKNNNN